MRPLFLTALFFFLAGIARPQAPLTCATGAVNPAVRAEGIAETLGDILLTCTGGTAGTPMTLNLVVFLNVNVTNRLTGVNTTDVSLTVDSGSGPVPLVAGVLQSSTAVAFNSVTFTIPASQKVNLRISNLRGNVSQMAAGFQQAIQAVLSINSIPVGVVSNTSPLSVGIPAPGLLATLASSGIRCFGSSLPSTVNFANLLANGTLFVSTRVTEGFPDSFQKKAGTNDTGIRIRASYSGFPPGATLWLPDVVAGSDALQPTAAGDLGGTVSGGAYNPGSGALLLSRVNGADANGAGGVPVYVPGPAGSPTVTLNSVCK